MPATPAHPDQINFGWLIRLRWSMIAGQLAAIVVVRVGLELAVPLPALLTIIALEAALNFLAMGALASEWWLAGIMAFDIVMFTGLLYFTGGPSNPFSFLYLVQIALAAITLRAGWTWALTALALLGSAVLFLWHRPFPDNVSHAAYMNMHLRGMWVAFGVAAGFIVYFLLRVRCALEMREAELAASRRDTARQERLASLATLAAGAAHELSTPLATIAVVMKELEHLIARITAGSDDDEAMNDVRLVRAQVDRCRAILERMSSEAGTSVGEAFVTAPVAQVVTSVLEGLSTRVGVRIEIAHDDQAKRLHVPPRAFSQALRGLIKNAQDASPDGSEIVLRVRVADGELQFEVHDHGGGIPPDIIDRIGEPFFTTKPTGHGMGLGVFLARAVVERLGGQVVLNSSMGIGTVATVQLPAGLFERGLGGPLPASWVRA
ncbi:MAG: HAMP domain-containing histidine kinase [Deltaproteobacteria bacterium]|nr:HAMP domain-containing histidine kinase [Deltaproteobacteria bacterium]